MDILLYFMVFTAPIGILIGAAMLAKSKQMQTLFRKRGGNRIRVLFLGLLFLLLILINAIGTILTEHGTPIFILGFCIGIYFVHCFVDDRL